MATQAPITHFIGTRVAIVTGGAQGIGKAIALRLAADGLDICVDDVASKTHLLKEVVAEIQQLGRKAIALPYDVTKEQEVKEMVEKTVAELGRLDVMVANAGIVQYSNSVMEANIDEWESVWAVNMRGPVLCYKYAAIQMVKQNSGGRLIGPSSICGLQGFTNAGAYCMSKASVRSLTQTASLELSKHGITVNAYAPGVIETPMTTHPTDKDLGGPCAAIKRATNIPHAKVGQPEQVASLVSYLASAESHFLTGQTISIDGGLVFN